MCTVIKSGYKLCGNITFNDIFNICPYEDTIVILSLNYAELRKIIEEQDIYKDKYRKKLGLYGVNPAEKGKITNLNKQNLLHFFKGKDKANVAFSSYDVAGAGNRYPVLRKIAIKTDARALDTQIPLRDAVVKYIRNKSLEK